MRIWKKSVKQKADERVVDIPKKDESGNSKYFMRNSFRRAKIKGHCTKRLKPLSVERAKAIINKQKQRGQ